MCKGGLITGNSTDGFVLPTYEEYLKIAVSIEELEGIEDFLRNKLDGSSYQYVKNIKVLPLISDPTKEDTDGDEICDSEDPKPLKEFSKKFQLVSDYNIDYHTIYPESYYETMIKYEKLYNSKSIADLSTDERLSNAI